MLLVLDAQDRRSVTGQAPGSAVRHIGVFGGKGSCPAPESVAPSDSSSKAKLGILHLAQSLW